MKDKELYSLVAQILGIDITQVTDNLERESIEEWDSFNHLMLVSEIEKETGTKLTTAEIESIKSIKDLKEIITKKS